MHIQIIQIGKTKNSYIREAEQEYLQRLEGFGRVEVTVLRESHINESSNNQLRAKAVEAEGKEILEALPKQSFVVVLDERGKSMDSVEFAQKLKQIRDYEGGKITFVIGGAFGLSDHVRSKANLLLSFSSFTFTHEMIRMLLLEQLFRASTILGNKTYHY
jgi:23S rRNA (pseudouridine1915-N3)-methyltransferase